MVVVLLLIDDVSGQCVVAFERVGPDDQIAHAGIIRQFHWQRGAAALGPALPCEDLPLGVMVRDVLLQRFADGLLQVAAPTSSSRRSTCRSGWCAGTAASAYEKS